MNEQLEVMRTKYKDCKAKLGDLLLNTDTTRILLMCEARECFRLGFNCVLREMNFGVLDTSSAVELCKTTARCTGFEASRYMELMSALDEYYNSFWIGDECEVERTDLVRVYDVLEGFIKDVISRVMAQETNGRVLGVIV